jgi:L-2-hydroxyglutarate oxidase LhgO
MSIPLKREKNVCAAHCGDEANSQGIDGWNVYRDTAEVGWWWNGLDVELLNGAALREAEPNVRGLGAIKVATTGIIDYALVSRTLADLIAGAGGTVETGQPVRAIRETLDDLLPHEAGIRAQAVRRDGTLAHDFLLKTTPRSIHVLNAPSPAATSALPIGETLARRLFSA